MCALEDQVKAKETCLSLVFLSLFSWVRWNKGHLKKEKGAKVKEDRGRSSHNQLAPCPPRMEVLLQDSGHRWVTRRKLSWTVRWLLLVFRIHQLYLLGHYENQSRTQSITERSKAYPELLDPLLQQARPPPHWPTPPTPAVTSEPRTYLLSSYTPKPQMSRCLTALVLAEISDTEN